MKIAVVAISILAGFVTPPYLGLVFNPQIVWEMGYAIPDGVYIARLEGDRLVLSKVPAFTIGSVAFINFKPLMPRDVVFFYSRVCPLSLDIYVDAMASVAKDLKLRYIYIVSCENLFLGVDGCATRASRSIASLISTDGGVSGIPEIVVNTVGGARLFSDFINEKLSEDQNYTRSRELWQAIKEFIKTYTRS